MHVVVEEAGPCRKTLRIEIPADRVSGEYAKVLAEYARQARIPGFRPGRAPRDLVDKRYGREIRTEVKDRLIPVGYHEAIEQQKIDAVAILGVQDVSFEPGCPLSFAVTLDVPPTFELPEYRGISLPGEKVDVAPPDVEEALKNLLDQHARYEEAGDRAARKGDLALVDYEGVCDGKPVDELAPGAQGLGKAADFWLLVEENAFLPGFAEALTGSRAGEKKQVFVDFPADFRVPALAGRKATYFVDVKGLREKRAPELDANFLAGFNVKTEEELRQAVERDLRALRAEREKGRLKGAIVRHLLERTALAVPGSVVDEETRSVVYDIVRDTAARGASREQIEDKKEDIFRLASQSATDRVKARYIVHRIAERENIRPTAEEVEARLQQWAERYRVAPETLREELKKRNRLDLLSADLEFEKTLDFLLEQAKVTTETGVP